MQTPQNEKIQSKASRQQTENLHTSAAVKTTPAFLRNLQYMGLLIANTFSRAKLQRIPEPSALTDQELHVEEYSHAIDSIMILPYVLVLNLVSRLTDKKKTSITALDLCCGPGHFTRLLAKHLICDEVVGVDLSEPMLKKARENALQENLSAKLKYVKSDVASLQAIPSKSMDVVSFMDGAHHMDSISTVEQILREADRVAKTDGIIVLLDPVRPKNSFVANLYHKIAGQVYLSLGLPHFNKDFYDSLYASWTPTELFQAIPKGTGRQWVQMVPFGFPAFQIIFGVPESRTDLYLGSALPQEVISSLIPKDTKSDWWLLNLTFKWGQKIIFRSGLN